VTLSVNEMVGEEEEARHQVTGGDGFSEHLPSAHTLVMFPTVRQIRGVVIGRHVVHLYAHGKCAPSELVRRLWWGAAALPFGQGLGLKGSPLRRTSISLSPGPVRCYPQAWQPPNCHKLTVHSTISLGYRMEAGSQNRILAMMQARLTPNRQSVTQPHVTKITDLVLKSD
jgi:hypothetical protein